MFGLVANEHGFLYVSVVLTRNISPSSENEKRAIQFSEAKPKESEKQKLEKAEQWKEEA